MLRALLRLTAPTAPTPNDPHGGAGNERTWNFKQDDVVRSVDVTAGRKVFDLSLTELGPYSIDFTRNGRYMLLGGAKGHLALMDWQRSHLVCEVQVRATAYRNVRGDVPACTCTCARMPARCVRTVGMHACALYILAY